MRTEIVKQIAAAKVMAIVRLDDQLRVAPVLETLVRAGIRVLEITSNTPGYAEELRKARGRYPDILIGAGTITHAALAEEAIRHQAQFLVTPNMNIEVIAEAHGADIPVLMGALTPTEIAVGVAHGADFIKLFPAGTIGVDYFKTLSGPFKDVRFFAVGGVDESNVSDWLRAGIAGVGIGGSLTRGPLPDMGQAVKRLLALIIK